MRSQQPASSPSSIPVLTCVALVSPCLMMRYGVRQLLEKEGWCGRIREYSSVEQLRERSPGFDGLIVVDFSGRGWLKFRSSLHWICQRRLRLLAILDHQAPEILEDVEGVAVVSTGDSGKVYLEGALAANQSVGYRSQSLREKAEAEELIDRYVRLSNREQEVFELLGERFSTEEIASVMGIKIKTVEAHKEHMKRKLEIETCQSLVVSAVLWKHGIAE